MRDWWKTAHIFGGGTFSDVRPHFALAAPAFGTTAGILYEMFLKDYGPDKETAYQPIKQLTKMAGGDMRTNEDVSKRLDELIADPNTKIIIMSAALCDWDAVHMSTLDTREYGGGVLHYNGTHPVGKEHLRLRTADYKAGDDGDGIDDGFAVVIKPSDKLIGKIRKERKDIFLVGFKTTTSASEDEQFLAGLGLLKGASCNLVLANDTVTRKNMIVTPEEARYSIGNSRVETLAELYEMIQSRSRLTFTRSTVIDHAPLADWDTDERIPDSLRTVVNHCIKRGAYKPFNGKTVGHFATSVSEHSFLTSIRKTNFNDLSDVGMVLVEAIPNSDKVIAYGAKPSVGGQSQRIVFTEHPGYNCIVHFHCPLRDNADISTRAQKPYECGSHECGKNTSDGLTEYQNLDGPKVKAVMLDKHGPNIVFNRNINPQAVIDFIERNWDLDRSTSEVTIN